MGLAGLPSPPEENSVENIITEVSNTPIEIPDATNKNIFIIHADNRLNTDATFIKLWNDDVVTYATEEPDIKFKMPASKQGAVRIPYSAAGGTAVITPENEKWWVATSSSSAVAGAAPTTAVDLRITREE